MTIKDLFKENLFADFDKDDILADIPNSFGMELNFSGIKENDIFSMGVHYHDSDNEDFNIEAKGKNTEELINNLIINFSKMTFKEEKIKENEIYDKLFEDYQQLNDDYYDMMNEYENLEAEYERLEDDYKKLFSIYEKIQDVLELKNF